MIIDITLVFIISIIYQIIFYKTTNPFRVNKLKYLLSTILSIIIIFILNGFKQYSLGLKILLSLVLQTLIVLSFIDIKYLEISKYSYYFLLIPILIINFLTRNIVRGLISFIVIFIVFFILDFLMTKVFNFQFVKNDKGKYILRRIDTVGVGGADMKTLLILVMSIDWYESISLILFVTFFSIPLFIIMIIKNKSTNIKIPLMVSITISYIYIYNYFSQLIF